MGVLRYVAGIAFLILGVIGLFLPVLQGILFILIGLAILFPRNRYVEQLITRGRNRWPEQAARMDAWKQRLRVFFRASGRVGVAAGRELRLGERFFTNPLAINFRSSAKGRVSRLFPKKMGFLFFVFCDI